VPCETRRGRVLHFAHACCIILGGAAVAFADEQHYCGVFLAHRRLRNRESKSVTSTCTRVTSNKSGAVVQQQRQPWAFPYLLNLSRTGASPNMLPESTLCTCPTRPFHLSRPWKLQIVQDLYITFFTPHAAPAEDLAVACSHDRHASASIAGTSSNAVFQS
jgi:hypothetical protein